MDLSSFGLPALSALFAFAAIIIVAAGSKLVHAADAIADQTGMGEAIAGAILLGAATSLPGVITSVHAGATGLASLAYSNAVGGIAAQTLFLIIADLTFKRVNLEHAAASLSNIVNGLLLIVMIALMMTAAAGPDISVFGIHPVSLLCFGVYLYGLHFARSARARPMWKATETNDTRQDKPEDDNVRTPLSRTLPVFFGCLLAVGLAGYLVADIAAQAVNRLGFPQSATGALLTAVVTSTPELVTTIAAVQRRALQLAVGGIIGGNAFDTLFAAFADIAYRDGSIYHAIGEADFFLTAVVLAMTAILVLGMVRREREGIGFEGWGVMGLYVAAVAGVLAMA